jgi:hypothetical protein
VPKRKFLKSIASSYIIVTKERVIENVTQWLNNRRYVQSKLLTVKTIVEMNRDTHWQYINHNGLGYSVAKPRRGYHYYYCTFGVDDSNPAANTVKDKQLRIQNSMIDTHFRNSDGYQVFDAQLFKDQREFNVEDEGEDSDEEIREPGPYKLRYNLNTKKEELLHILYQVIDERDKLRKENQLLKQNMEQQQDDEDNNGFIRVQRRR